MNGVKERTEGRVKIWLRCDKCAITQNLTQTELLAKEKKDEKNRKLREWRAKRKAQSNSVDGGGASAIVMPNLTHAQLLAKEKREEKSKKQREWRERSAKRKAESNNVQDEVASYRTIHTLTSCHSQLTESQKVNHSELSSTDKKSENEMLSIDKKREQKTKYQREWRARKNAKLNNVDGWTATSSTPAIGKIDAFR